jgi:hypothetical protein
MRLLLTILLLAVSCAAQPTQTPAAPAEGESARRAREVLDKTIQALGGEAYLNLQDKTEEGRTYGFSQGEPAGVGSPYWRFWRWPDKERIEFTKDRDIILTLNGDKAFETTFRGTAEVEPKELEEFLNRRQYALETVLRTWLTEPGTMLFYEGQTLAERRLTHKVTVLNSRNQSVTLSIDADKFLPIRKQHTWRRAGDRLNTEDIEIYDNYRLIQGIMTPHTVGRMRDGLMVGQRFVHKVAYNTGVADSLFAAAVGPPKKK